MESVLLQYIVAALATGTIGFFSWFIVNHGIPWLTSQIQILKANQQHHIVDMVRQITIAAVRYVEQTAPEIDNPAKKEMAVKWAMTHLEKLGIKVEEVFVADFIETVIKRVKKDLLPVIADERFKFLIQQNMMLQGQIEEMGPSYLLGKRMTGTE